MGAVKDGKVRLLAVATLDAWPQMPTTPTFAQTLPGFEASAWFGLCAPASTPGADVVGSTADELRILMAREQARWTRITRATGIGR